MYCRTPNWEYKGTDHLADLTVHPRSTLYPHAMIQVLLGEISNNEFVHREYRSFFQRGSETDGHMAARRCVGGRKTASNFFWKSVKVKATERATHCKWPACTWQWQWRRYEEGFNVKHIAGREGRLAREGAM